MPKLQQQAAKMTRAAWEGLMRTAAFVPEEKRDWVPQGKARTLHDILVECAVLPGRYALLLGNEELPPPDREGYERAKAALSEIEQRLTQNKRKQQIVATVAKRHRDTGVDALFELITGGNK